MHPRSYHKDGYPMAALCSSFPPLKPYVISAKSGQKSIDFANSEALIALNTALLTHYYNVKQWQLPKGYLCPPIPGRADYIHGIADLLANSLDTPEPSADKEPSANKEPSTDKDPSAKNAKSEKHSHAKQTVVSSLKSTNAVKAILGPDIKGLDIGVGVNAIYPIIGSQVYEWSFVGSDIDKTAYKNASTIIRNNTSLRSNVEIRRQRHSEHIFAGIIGHDDYFTFTMCNPPFHKSAQDALVGSARKNKNLVANQTKRSGKNNHPQAAKRLHSKPKLNFAGQANELWCEGGELAFIQRMITESVEFKHKVTWFTCLVSKSAHIKPIEKSLAYHRATQTRVVNMEQGNKQSRFVAWRFT